MAVQLFPHSQQAADRISLRRNASGAEYNVCLNECFPALLCDSEAYQPLAQARVTWCSLADERHRLKLFVPPGSPPNSFLFRHDQRGGRQLRLAADQKSCLAPALVFCRFRRPWRTGVVQWRRSVILVSGLDSAQGGKWKESCCTGGCTAVGNRSKLNNKDDRRE